MTKVDVCCNCRTLFDEGEEHCRRCGADRSTHAVKEELRDLCPTYKGEGPEREDIAREVKPIFEPRWGKVQWYEMELTAKDKKGAKRKTEKD